MRAPDLPFQRIQLDNGLVLLVHEDHKVPIVSVNLWYHVGSKNERRGRTGFAHLFEHLMFEGSEHHDAEYFEPFELVGVSEINGTTNRDRTNYFQTVPANALDVALWMESDRMGHFVGAITQEKLDEQRSVVQNEKRQGDNQPYGRVFDLIAGSTYPAEHPYSWPVIGAMEDLDAASLDDVREWFETYYGPSNAVLSIAGDVDTADVVERVTRHFGDIQPGPALSRPEVWIAPRSGEQRHHLTDQVAQSRIYMIWNVPQIYSSDYHRLQLAADVLSQGKVSRLYKRLVYEDRIATDVAAYLWSGEIGSQFIIQASAVPDSDLDAVESAVREELARLLDGSARAEELERVRTQQWARFIRGFERIGGFGGKSDLLAAGEVLADAPDAYLGTLEDFDATTPESLRETAARWLSDGCFLLEVHPRPRHAARGQGVDRSRLPEPSEAVAVRFPDLERFQLSNGLNVILAERHSTPLVAGTLVVDSGYAADSLAAPGTAWLTMAMLDEGTATHTSLEISEKLASLGARLGVSADLDACEISLSSLTPRLDPALEIYREVVLTPGFPEHEVERLRKEQIVQIRRELNSPVQMALRLMPRLLYGEEHPYGTPMTGSGTIESVAGILRQDLVDFWGTWLTPRGASLVVVGDTTRADVSHRLEDAFGGWSADHEPPALTLPEVPDRGEAEIYLLDRPGSPQSLVLGGSLVGPRDESSEARLQTMLLALGGAFTSRINMNLREDKGWSYGAHSFIVEARGQRPLIAYAQVQTDKTGEAIREIQKEIRAMQGDRPIETEELERARRQQTLSLPGRWEAIWDIRAAIVEMVRLDLPDDYWQKWIESVSEVTIADVTAAASLLRPESMLWIVVGDSRELLDPLQRLDMGGVQLLDPDGRPQA